jgi:ubiquinone/menaquinone biosynthesis C-methylase UbiE
MIDDLADRLVRAAAAEGRGTPARVLDAGCGTGRVAAHLRGVDVLGIDLSAGMLATAREQHPTLPLVAGALEALPVGTGTVDGVLAWYSWVHTPSEDLPAVVAETARVLAPGGHLLVAFQAGSGERRVLTQAYGHAVALTHVRHDPAHVERLLTAVGLDVRVRMLREPEGRERTPQAALLAVRLGEIGRAAARRAR